MSVGQPRGRTLAEKLDHLFTTLHARGQREYSYKQVADAIQARGGPTISASYLWQLRKGLKDNPTKRQLEALADFFEVPPAYFFDTEIAVRVDAELELLRALRDSGVRQVAFRASGLSPHSLTKIAEMIDFVRELEGLPATPDEPDHPQAVEAPDEATGPSQERTGETR